MEALYEMTPEERAEFEAEYAEWSASFEESQGMVDWLEGK